MTMNVDNSLSPHGGALVERVKPLDGTASVSGLPTIEVREQIVHECVNIAYGFFSPLTGFMGSTDVASVSATMRLTGGYVWPIPIVLDVARAELEDAGVSVGDTALLTHGGNPLATLDVSEIFEVDLTEMARQVYTTTDQEHPGVQRTLGYADRFVAGDITLVCEPVINPPFDRFWRTPAQLRADLAEVGWRRAVAHQTRNVPPLRPRVPDERRFHGSPGRRRAGQRSDRRKRKRATTSTRPSSWPTRTCEPTAFFP